MKKHLLALIGLAASTIAAGADGTHRFYGYAYDLASNKYLYTETHEQKIAGGKWLGGSITYTAPDGSALGKKTLDFSQDGVMPVYRLDLVKDGYMEALTDARGPILLARRSKTGEQVETKTLRKEGLMTADSGFHSFIIEHFKALMNGETVKFRFIAAGKLDSFKFRGKRVADTTFEGKPAVHFKVEPDSFLRLLAGPLEMTYDAQSKKLLEYRGISNIHDPATGEAYKAVRIAYYSVAPADAPKLPPLK